MKEYTVKYELKGYGYITVTADDEDDAMDEINRVFCGENPKYEDNDWIDEDALWDIEWSTTDVINVINAIEI
jgi:hypothetical protein